MKEWSIRRLYRDSISFRWGARFFLLALILTVSIFIYQETTKKNNFIFNNQNSTFYSPNLQGDFRHSNISISVQSTNYDPDDECKRNYPKSFGINASFVNFRGNKVNLYNLKFILPDYKEAFLKKAIYNESYTIGECNDQLSDCCVYHKYIVTGDLSNKDICWIHTTRLTGDVVSDSIVATDEFYINPESCMKEISN